MDFLGGNRYKFKKMYSIRINKDPPSLLFLTVYYDFYFFKKLLFIYLRASTSRGTSAGEGEAGFPQSRELDAGLDPRTWDHDLS